MSKTDGLILNRVYNVSDEKLRRCCFACVIIWIISPIAAIVSNILKIDGYNFCGVWLTFLYLSGGLGLLFGGLFLLKKFLLSTEPKSVKISLAEPLILLFLFFCWCIICTFFAEEKVIAIYGYERYHDNLFVYLFYGGMILSGITLKSREEYFVRVGRVFVSIAVILAIVALMNNKITERLCHNSLTDTGGYEAVFFDTEHFAMYLVMAITVCVFLLLRSTLFGERMAMFAVSELLVATLTFTGSISGIGAVFFVLCTIMLFYRRNGYLRNAWPMLLFASLILTVVLLAVTVPVKLHFPNEIVTYWKNTLLKFQMASVVGIGPQNSLGYTYNVFLKIALYTGVPGLLLYLASFIVSLKLIFTTKDSLSFATFASLAVVIGYFVVANFGMTMFYTAPYFYIAVGSLFGACLKPILSLEINSEKIEKST